jgi:hypothetical protein
VQTKFLNNLKLIQIGAKDNTPVPGVAAINTSMAAIVSTAKWRRSTNINL